MDLLQRTTQVAVSGPAAAAAVGAATLGLSLLVGGTRLLHSPAPPQVSSAFPPDTLPAVSACVHHVLSRTASAGAQAKRVAWVRARATAVVSHAVLSALAVQPILDTSSDEAGGNCSGRDATAALSSVCPRDTLLYRCVASRGLSGRRVVCGCRKGVRRRDSATTDLPLYLTSCVACLTP